MDIEQLPQARNFRIDYVIGQHHGEWFVAYQLTRPQDRVSESQRLLLPDIRHVDHIRHIPHHGKQLAFAARLQQLLQLEADIEVILDGRLAPARDDDHVLNAGMDRFFHPVLDERLVHQRQHFLRLSFRGREEPCPQASRRKHRLAHFREHTSSVSFE